MIKLLKFLKKGVPLKKIALIFLFILIPLGGIQAASGQNLYSDQKRGFSLEVPPGWEVRPQKKGDLALALVKRSPLKPFHPSIIITLINAKLNMPENKDQLKSIVDQVSGPSKQVANIQNFKIVKSAIDKKRRIFSFYYQTTYELSRVKDPKAKKVKALNFIFRDQGRHFAVSLIAPYKEYKKYEKIAYQVIDSIKLFEPEVGKKKG